MTKADSFLKALKENVGNWTCSKHTSEGSLQPAATFREIKMQGYFFEEISPNRWGKRMICPICENKTTHYKLLKIEPIFNQQFRSNIDQTTRKRILKIFNNRDAFTGASISSTPEIDHKEPWSRTGLDIDINKLDKNEIPKYFQLLTREHNLLKDRICSKCKKENIRPPFLGISFWYEGNQKYCGTCMGCGWYDGIRWREEINKVIMNKND